MKYKDDINLAEAKELIIEHILKEVDFLIEFARDNFLSNITHNWKIKGTIYDKTVQLERVKLHLELILKLAKEEDQYLGFRFRDIQTLNKRSYVDMEWRDWSFKINTIHYIFVMFLIDSNFDLSISLPIEGVRRFNWFLNWKNQNHPNFLSEKQGFIIALKINYIFQNLLAYSYIKRSYGRILNEKKKLIVTDRPMSLALLMKTFRAFYVFCLDPHPFKHFLNVYSSFIKNKNCQTELDNYLLLYPNKSLKTSDGANCIVALKLCCFSTLSNLSNQITFLRGLSCPLICADDNNYLSNNTGYESANVDCLFDGCAYDNDCPSYISFCGMYASESFGCMKYIGSNDHASNLELICDYEDLVAWGLINITDLCCNCTKDNNCSLIIVLKIKNRDAFHPKNFYYCNTNTVFVHLLKNIECWFDRDFFQIETKRDNNGTFRCYTNDCYFDIDLTCTEYFCLGGCCSGKNTIVTLGAYCSFFNVLPTKIFAGLWNDYSTDEYCLQTQLDENNLYDFNSSSFVKLDKKSRSPYILNIKSFYLSGDSDGYYLTSIHLSQKKKLYHVWHIDGDCVNLCSTGFLISSENIRSSTNIQIHALISMLFYYSWEFYHYCQSDFDCVNAQINIYNRRLNLHKCSNNLCGFCSTNSDCSGIVGGLNTCDTMKYCWSSGGGITLANCNTVSYDYGYVLNNQNCYICRDNNGISKCPSNSCASTNIRVCANKCSTDSDCPYNMPVCDTTTYQCQSCSTSTICSNHGMSTCTIMTTGYGYCSQSCTSDLNCVQIEFKPYCIYFLPPINANRCSECPSDEWCHVNRTMKVCHYTRGVCLNNCSSNGDCLNPARSKCSTDGFCVGCTTDSECSQVISYKYCINMICKQCTTDNQCPEFDPVASYCVSNYCKAANGCNQTRDCTLQTASKCSSGNCIACTADSECAHILGPRTYCVSGTCVECTTNSHCTTPFRSLCASNLCSKCTANADCTHMTNGRNTTCNVPSGECVCTTNGGCNNPSLSKCSSGVCSACSTNGDCTHTKNSMTTCNSGICKKSCTSNADCMSPLNSLCSTLYCSPCSANADCFHMKGYMTICVIGECKQCYVNSDCILPYKSACRNNQCTFCLSNSDCAHVNGNPCVFGSCFECTRNTDCVDPSKSKCVSNKCQPCTAGTDCKPQISLTSACSAGVCSGCQANYNCISASASKCSVGICVACTTDNECSHIADGLHFCSSGVCNIHINCTTNTNCITSTASNCVSGSCVACAVNGDCSHITGGMLALGLHYCISGICKECTTSVDCGSDDRSLCSANFCTDCAINEDCSARPVNKYCFSTNCVLCLTDNNCTTAIASKCSGNTCVNCTTDGECSHITGGVLGSGLKYCAFGECRECSTNSHCNSDDKSLCSANFCTDCAINEDCSARPVNKYCFSTNCVLCLANSNCTTAIASKCSGNTCVNCTTDGDCSHITGGVLGSGLKYCAFGECRECSTNSHCNSDDKSLCSTNVCADCAINEDCSSRQTNKLCIFGNCVICFANADCTKPSASKCLSLNCVACVVDGDCSHIAGGTVLLGLKFCVSSVCKECTANIHCDSNDKSLCSALGVCSDCASNGDCSLRNNNKFCISGDCVECAAHGDCNNDEKPVCDIVHGVCIECATNGDCSMRPTNLVCGLGVNSGLNLCVECIENLECLSINYSVCNIGRCAPCNTNGDCFHLLNTSKCHYGYHTCVECVVDTDCDNIDKICINAECKVTTDLMNQILTGVLGITNIHELVDELSNTTDIDGINIMNDTYTLLDQYNASNINELFNEIVGNNTNLTRFVDGLINNNTNLTNLVNNLVDDNANLTSLVNSLMKNSKPLSVVLDSNEYEKVYQAINDYMTQKSLVIDRDFMNISEQLILSIDRMLNQKNGMDYIEEEIIYISAAIKNTTNLTSSMLLKNNSVSNSSIITVVNSQNALAIELISKVVCGESLFPLIGAIDLLEAIDNMLLSVKLLNGSNNSVTPSIDTYSLLNNVESKLIDHLNATQNTIMFNGSIFSTLIKRVSYSELVSVPKLSIPYGGVGLDLNNDGLLQMKHNYAEPLNNNSFIVSLKKWTPIELPMAGANSSFDKLIRNASVLSNPITVCLMDATTKLPIINLNKSLNLMNITVAIVGEIVKFENDKTNIGGLLYDTVTHEWRFDGVLNTTLSSDNKTATIMASHSADFQLYSYIKNQILDANQKSNSDMLLDPSILVSNNNGFYISSSFLIMMAYTAGLIVSTINVVIYEKFEKHKIFQATAPRNKNIVMSFLKAAFLTHEFIAAMSFYEKDISRACRVAMYFCNVYTMFSLASLFHQSENDAEDYSYFQLGLIFVFNLIINEGQGFVLEYFLTRALPKPHLDTEISIKVRETSNNIKMIFGFLLILITVLGNLYCSCVILAHFSEKVRGKWIKSFVMNFLFDNLIEHLLKVLILGTLLVGIVKGIIKGRMKILILRAMDKNIIRCFGLQEEQFQ